MAGQYDPAFVELYRQISAYSPQSADLLQKMLTEYGAQTAYYASFILVVIQARIEQSGLTILKYLATDQLREFTFFEYAKDNPQALALFDEIYKIYQMEQHQRLDGDGKNDALAAD
jgi:hypothetical protein